MGSGTAFNLDMTADFFRSAMNLPKQVQKKIDKDVIPRLRSAPDVSDPPVVKKLAGWKDFWRYRIDTYRIAYRVNHSRKEVTLLIAGHRKNVYDRIDHIPGKGPPLRIAKTKPELVGTRTTIDEARGSDNSDVVREPAVEYETSRPLPIQITKELLHSASIPDDYWENLLKLETDDDLLRAPVPDEVASALLEVVFPPPKVEELLASPSRIIGASDRLDEAFEGKRTLESFLLKLDDEQNDLVGRLSKAGAKGPWIIRGGPGTGKSTVALYCLRNLLKAQSEDLFKKGDRLQVLFTTYTNSLCLSAEYLLKSLKIKDLPGNVTVATVDRAATPALPDEWLAKEPISESALQEFVEEAMRGSTESSLKPAFVTQEIEWTIFGNGVPDLESYLSLKRAGREKPLGPKPRAEIWEIYEVVRELLRDCGVSTFTQRMAVAAFKAEPFYDYVFIDEAQDLVPVALRLSSKLCKDPSHVLVCADLNQSIYRANASWASVTGELGVRPRGHTLRRCYRTTREITKAVTSISDDPVDTETLAYDVPLRGPRPVLHYARDDKAAASRMNDFIHKAVKEEEMDLSCAAVLCPANYDCEEIAAMLDPGLKPRAMRTREVQMDYPGVKVITMYAAKGLEFPVVVVARVEEGRVPWKPREGQDVDEHNARFKRLLSVACSRAMRHLLVTASREAPSPFLSDMKSTWWEIENGVNIR